MLSKSWSCLAASLILCLLTAGCIPQKNTQSQDAPVEATVRTETVVIPPVVTAQSLVLSNVREKNSSKSAIVDVLPKGTQIKLLGKKGNWYHIQRADGTGKPGYIYHRLAALDFGNYLGTQGHNKVQSQIYDSPKKSSGTAQKLPPQTQFEIIGYEDGFYRIKNNNVEGFIVAETCVAHPSDPIAKSKTITVTSRTTTTTSTTKTITKAPKCPPQQVAEAEKSISSQKTARKKSSSSQKEVAAKDSGNDNSSFGSFFDMFKPKEPTADEKAKAIQAAKEHKKKSGGGLMSIFADSGDQKNKDQNSKEGNKNSSGAAEFFSNFMNSAKTQSANSGQFGSLQLVLKQIDQSKKLAAQTIAIKKQMLAALNETRALQQLVGSTVMVMNNNYKAATAKAQGVKSVGMDKISIKAFIKDLSYEPSDSIETAAVKIAENRKMLKALSTQIKTEAASFSKLNAVQIKNLDSIIGTLSTNLHASNALYDMSMSKSSNVIGSIDQAINAYDEKGKTMAVEATKQLGVLALAGTAVVELIGNAQNNPIGAIAAIPTMIEAQEQLTDLVCLFKDFKQDYDYIEENSELITKQSQEINNIIMTARRKNTQVRTILEGYYQNKLALSKKLKSKLENQAKDGYKQVEDKAVSVALAEDILD